MLKFSKLTDQQLDKAIKLVTILIIACVVFYGIVVVWQRYVSKPPTITDKAIARAVEEVEKKPNNVNLRIELANLYLDNKDSEGAIDQFQAALKISSKNGAALTGMGMALLEKGDHQEALKYFDKEIKNASKGQFADIDTALEKAYFYSGMVYLTDKYYDEAITKFKKALAIKKTASDTYLYLGMAYYKKGNTKDAIKSLKNAILFEPQFAPAHYYLGLSYKKAGKTAEAKSELNKALKYYPDYKEAKKALEEI